MGLADRRSATPDAYRDLPERFSNWGAGDPRDGLGTLSSTSARAARTSAAREARGGSPSITASSARRPPPVSSPAGVASMRLIGRRFSPLFFLRAALASFCGMARGNGA